MSFRRTGALAAFGVAIAFGVAVAAGVDETRDDTSVGNRYQLDCKILMATDNETIPPTLFGRYPSKGVLTFVATGEVTNGKLGTTRLEGTRFAMFGRAAGDWKRGKRFEWLSLYLDEASSPEQRRAMGSIFRTDDLFRADGMTSLSTVKIAIDRPSPDALAETTVRLGPEASRGEIKIVPLKGADGTNPIAIQNAFTFFDENEAVQVGTSTINVRDHGHELRTTSGSGEIHFARLKGVVHGVVEDGSR
jgi:hypothetical protein